MFRPKKVLLVCLLLIVLTAIPGAIILRQTTKTVPLSSDSALAAEAKSLVKEMLLLEYQITCTPGTQVSILAGVIADTPDYRATDFDRQVIEKVYGKEGLSRAGLLTAKRAYYRWRTMDSTTPPPPGVKPTQRPVYICHPDPEERLDQSIRFQSIEQAKDERIVVVYSYTTAEYEAILRRINGKWMVTSVRVTHWYGAGTFSRASLLPGPGTPGS